MSQVIIKQETIAYAVGQIPLAKRVEYGYNMNVMLMHCTFNEQICGQ